MGDSDVVGDDLGGCAVENSSLSACSIEHIGRRDVR